MIQFDRVPKRVWVTGGVALALCCGVAAAGAGVKAIRQGDGPLEQPASAGRVLKIDFAAPAPLEMPAAAAASDRFDVLAPPPVSLVNLDPDVQQATDYAALATSMKRYEAQIAADAVAYDARPLPTALSIDVPNRPEPILLRHAGDEPAPAAHEDDVAASGDTGHAAAPAHDAD